MDLMKASSVVLQGISPISKAFRGSCENTEKNKNKPGVCLGILPNIILFYFPISDFSILLSFSWTTSSYLKLGRA